MEGSFGGLFTYPGADSIRDDFNAKVCHFGCGSGYDLDVDLHESVFI